GRHLDIRGEDPVDVDALLPPRAGRLRRAGRAGTRPATVPASTRPGGDLPGLRYVPGGHPAQGVAVLPAEVDLVRRAVEFEGPGLDVLGIAAHIAGTRYLSDTCH